MVIVFNICSRYHCLRGQIFSNLFSTYFNINQTIPKIIMKNILYFQILFISSPWLLIQYTSSEKVPILVLQRILSEFVLCSVFVVLKGADEKRQEWQSCSLMDLTKQKKRTCYVCTEIFYNKLFFLINNNNFGKSLDLR